MEVPRSDQDHPEHGCQRSRGRQEGHGPRRGDLTKIAGQKPVVTKVRKRPIAGFKIREGQAIGCMVTLRGAEHVPVPGSFRDRGPAARS